MLEQLGISPKTEQFVHQQEQEIQQVLCEIDHVCNYNSMKVLTAFQKNRVSESDFAGTTGYGYNDVGRDKIEQIFSDIFGSEDSLVRNQFISGTHALTVTLFGLLRPGDVLLSISGKPYDTLDEVIGITENASSLKSFGVRYQQIDLVDGDFDYEQIAKFLQQEKVKVIEIQRSIGYSTRTAISIEQVQKVCQLIKQVSPETIIMIDNCYCEFVGTMEPIQVGADIVVGSLIKNLGGGIASNGAYVTGRKDLVHLVAERLTAPGEGKDVGPSLGANRSILQGLYLAPSVVAASLKTAVLMSKVMESLGYIVRPRWNEKRSDIVEQIELGNPDRLIRFVQSIQASAAIDADALPIPDDMPGYTSQIIMASGSFTQGSSIEVSCDGPLRDPYVAYFQGSLTYSYGKIAVMKAVEQMKKN